MVKKRPVALLTSDNHLQERAWASRRSLEGDAMWTFEWMIDYAFEEQIPAIISAGDLLDKQVNNSNVPDFLHEMMTKCERHSIEFYYIQGQHEKQDKPWVNAVHSWPKHLAELEEVWLGDLRVVGIDWTPKPDLQQELDEAVPSDTDVLVMHQVCAEWMGSITSPEIDSWSQIPYAKLLVVGDYHNYSGTIIRKNESGADMTILSPGPTAMQKISDLPTAHCYVLYSDLSLQQVQIPTRRVLGSPLIHFEEDLDEFVEELDTRLDIAAKRAEQDDLPEELLKPILYVQYQWDLKDANKRIARAVDGRAHLFVKELRPKEEEAELEAQREARQEIIDGGLKAALPSVISKQEYPEAYRVASNLLDTVNPELALNEMRSEFIDEA